MKPVSLVSDSNELAVERLATMKMESSSLKDSSGSSDALHGLKFGQKTYFDDSGSRSGSGSSSKPPPVTPPPQKKGKGTAHGRQQHQHPPPPRCQVEGCNVDLTGVKAYYCRHKVCGMHSKAPKVVVAGLVQRFCQQCSRFHQLAEFDQGKRSCRRRLAGHNERRRKPPPGTFASRYGQFAPRYHEQPRHRSFLMDFSYPTLSTPAIDRWPIASAGHRTVACEWHGTLDASPGCAVMRAHPCFHGPPMEFPPGEFSLAGVSNSSCALSLLSTHPWCSNSSGYHAPTIPASSTPEGSSSNQVVAVGDYFASSWAFGGHEGRTRPHEIQHEMGLLGGADEEASGARFTAQVQFADTDNGHSCPGMHWSL